jgi:hypothetical protein
MIFDFAPDLSLRFLSGTVVLLSSWALWACYKARRLVSAVSGLHVNVLLFCGIGPFCYTLYDSDQERVSRVELVQAMVESGLMFLLGYSIALLLERLLRRPVASRDSLASSVNVVWIGILLALSGAGYAVTAMGGGTSGLGTIFPLAKNLLYPAVMLIVLRCNRRDAQSVLISSAVLLLGLFVSVRSAWRSELIMFLGCIGLSVLLRSIKTAVAYALIGIASLFVLIPFQNYKKAYHEETLADLGGSFAAAQDIEFNARLETVEDFFGIRINSIREMGYVLKALDNGAVELRGGATYWESVLQLIPRFVWPNKPSFNQFTGFYLSRAVGLVAWDDENTSWGVNLFAEFLVNYPVIGLIWCVPLVFLVMAGMDRLASRLFVTPAAAWVTEAALFFLSFQLVGVINATTYYFWTFILIAVIDRFAASVVPVQADGSDAKRHA